MIYPSVSIYESRNEIRLIQNIIEEFERVYRNGVSAREKYANLWDYLEEVWLDLKRSVAKLIDLENHLLFVVSGRPTFCRKIAQMTKII